LRNARAFPLLPAALASVSFGFVLVRVRVRFKLSKKLALIGVDMEQYRRYATEGSIEAPRGLPELPDKMQSPLPLNLIDIDIPLALVEEEEVVLIGTASGSNGTQVDSIGIVGADVEDPIGTHLQRGFNLS